MRDIIWKRLLIFSGTTLISLVTLSVAYYKTDNSAVLTFLMLTPMLSVIITRILTGEGIRDLYIKPNFKGNIKWYIMAYLLTPLVAYVGAFLYFLIFPSQLDLMGSRMGMEVSSLDMYYKTLVTIIPLAIIVNPIVGLISCFGEEFAWRGYLLPNLRKKMPINIAVLLTGVIWGLWHVPIIATGYNYGKSNIVLGIIAMIIFCIVIGIIESYLFIRTKSVLTAVVFHSALNGIALWSPSDLLMSEDSNPFIGPNLIGVIGGIGFMFISVLCYIDMCRNRKFEL